jgi:hypothetical protein
VSLRPFLTFLSGFAASGFLAFFACFASFLLRRLVAFSTFLACFFAVFAALRALTRAD